MTLFVALEPVVDLQPMGKPAAVAEAADEIADAAADVWHWVVRHRVRTERESVHGIAGRRRVFPQANL